MSLRREISLFDAILLIVGNVVGAGIFTTSGFLARELPDPFLFVSIWILGGVLTICGALTYAELAALFPLAGGDYQFIKAAYGRWAGFLLGWTSFWIIGPGSTAALSLALVSYLQGFFHLGSILQGKFLAIAIIAAFSLINIRGVRPGGTTQDIVTMGTLATLVLLLLSGFLMGNGDWGNFTATTGGKTSWTVLFSTPMIAVIFTYSGWFASAYIGSEIRNPQRNLPLSLIIGTCIVMVLYTLMNMLYLYSMPIPALKGSINVVQTSVGYLFAPSLAGFASIPIILAIAASTNANILTGARVCYAMADDATFWPAFRKLHPLYNTPCTAILSQSLIATIMILLGSFAELLSSVVFVMILTSVATGVALFVLRKRQPNLPRPFKTWGYPFVPLVFIGAYTIIGIKIVSANPVTSLTGFAIALSGLPFFFWWNSRGRVLRTSVQE
ncbi:MAG: amino acid permease [Geobacteraceae bacterium]|nr:amino acid permease [Geobacteraceae bacterium]